MILWRFCVCMLLLIQISHAQNMESLFQAIERFDTKALSEIIEEKKLADSYLNYLSRVYRDYLYSGAIERKINLKKVTASPYRLLLFTHYQNVTRGGYEPKIHTALLDEISKSKDLKWRNRMHLALIQHLRPYIQKEPFLIELLEEYISKVEVKWLSKTNHFLYEKVLFEMYLQKREVKREFKTNTLIKKKLTYLDSLCPNINYYRAGIEQGKAIVALEFEKSKDKALQYLRKSLEYSTLDSYYFGRKKHTYTQNSLGILLRDMGRYKEAIEIFETLVNSPIITKNARSLLKIHISLEKCYAALNLSQKAHYHATEVNRLQDSINHLRQTEVILEKNYDYHLAEKEQKIHLAKAKERSLYQWLLLLIPILGISILMIFFLYRIYQQSRKEVKKIARSFMYQTYTISLHF